jgi:hypothetical protein
MLSLFNKWKIDLIIGEFSPDIVEQPSRGRELGSGQVRLGWLVMAAWNSILLLSFQGILICKVVLPVTIQKNSKR